jgi:hypothetical protein
MRQETMAARPAVLAFLALACALGGCRSRSDLVEAELRTRDAQLRELRDELARLTGPNCTLPEAAIAHAAAPPPPLTGVGVGPAPIKQILLSRQTGGLDNDGVPGDEALQVVVEPKDSDDHTVKVPGTLHVVAYQVTAEGLKLPLSSWDVNPDQLRRTWRNGFLSTGYFVVLPWKACPTSDKLRVVVQFTLADGRVFEADRDVTIHLPPAAPVVPGKPPIPGPPLQEDPGPPLRSGDAPPPPVAAFLGALRRPARPDGWQPVPEPTLADAVEVCKPVPLP